MTGVTQVSFHEIFSGLTNLKLSNMFTQDILKGEYFMNKEELKTFHRALTG